MDLSRPLSVVTPTVDGDVLAALARADAWFTTGRLHRVIDRHSDDGIRRSLRRLVLQGVVEDQNGGNAVLYRLNRDHLAASAIVELANLRSTLIEKLSQRLEAWSVSPTLGVLFGSAARSDMTLESDLDIFLVQPSSDHDADEWSAQVHELQRDVTRWTGNDVRVFELTEAHVIAHVNDEPVLRDVVREGVRLAGDLEWLGRLMTRAAVRA